MKITKADFRKYLAAFLAIAAFSYMGLITFCEVPEANINNANIILGFLISTALSTLIGFYFGASESEDKEIQEKPKEASVIDSKVKKEA